MVISASQPLPISNSDLSLSQPAEVCPEWDSYDYTDYVPGQEEWSYDNLPDILYELRPSGNPERGSHKDIPTLPSPWAGQPPLRFFEVLPDRISSQVEKFRVEAWMRLDRRVKYKDILARMNPRFRIGKGYLANNLTNFRKDFHVAMWWGALSRFSIASVEAEMVKHGLNPEDNSTRGLTPGLIDPRLGLRSPRIPVPPKYLNPEKYKPTSTSTPVKTGRTFSTGSQIPAETPTRRSHSVTENDSSVKIGSREPSVISISPDSTDDEGAFTSTQPLPEGTPTTQSSMPAEESERDNGVDGTSMYPDGCEYTPNLGWLSRRFTDMPMPEPEMTSPTKRKRTEYESGGRGGKTAMSVTATQQQPIGKGAGAGISDAPNLFEQPAMEQANITSGLSLDLLEFRLAAERLRQTVMHEQSQQSLQDLHSAIEMLSSVKASLVEVAASRLRQQKRAIDEQLAHLYVNHGVVGEQGLGEVPVSPATQETQPPPYDT